MSEENVELVDALRGVRRAALDNALGSTFDTIGWEAIDYLIDVARVAGPVRPPVPAGDAPELWLQLVDVDGEKRIRRWQSTPFEGGVRYVRETETAASINVGMDLVVRGTVAACEMVQAIIGDHERTVAELKRLQDRMKPVAEERSAGRFRAGDRVRRVAKTYTGWSVKQGSEYTVRALDRDGDIILDVDDPCDKMGWSAMTFELVAPAAPPLPDFRTWFHQNSPHAIATAPEDDFRYRVADYLDEMHKRVTL